MQRLHLVEQQHGIGTDTPHCATPANQQDGPGATCKPNDAEQVHLHKRYFDS
jgi:hypothetical protein